MLSTAEELLGPYGKEDEESEGAKEARKKASMKRKKESERKKNNKEEGEWRTGMKKWRGMKKE